MHEIETLKFKEDLVIINKILFINMSKRYEYIKGFKISNTPLKSI